MQHLVKHQNEAKDILYKDALYYADGSWTQEGFSNENGEKQKEKTTNAIDDTGDAIQSNLENSKRYAKKMERIQANVEELETSIPEFQEIRHIMNNNPKYDYNGDELLYFRNKLLPNVRKKRTLDSNELYIRSQLLYAIRNSHCRYSHCVCHLYWLAMLKHALLFYISNIYHQKYNHV